MVKTILSWVRENPVPDIHREIINRGLLKFES